ncbi:oxidoreductase, Gfo/Idh/MocA family [Myxococcus xanthus DK 1622]|uniref:Oxidoreductase, Gfo/Idh/MocA family n=2 Tax=Myxococcaceae TaxID=31 RepID=Q1D6R6_MYXXD|nr:oxidoreductase, Gfo/Idh/MocA family [Myxococcus xanthus DK 1622]NOJ52020.1 Gfo/Idh/MocA family oxidoreductase [Myxococcus xanthus]QVW65192.1 Gfo/Idh/MocA family oxidoreductase [Myxococcus xanthus DZ2]UEO01740.1 Gfo/Idh/MocA family oxidoreductase [Myxococcus xanthus DZ2]
MAGASGAQRVSHTRRQSMAQGSSRRIRYAVVGAGNIAQVAVLPAFQHALENSELVALFSSDAEKRDVLGKMYGVRHTASYDDLEQVLRDADVDAVYIALPNTQHRAFTERAARAGVHVLCEKPMATSVEDCEAMIRVTDENHVKLMIAYRLHFEEANLRAIDLLRSGRLGEPLMMSALLTQQVRTGDIRTRVDVGGGALLDEGPYPINAARYLFRDEPTEVFCYTNEEQDPRFKGVDATAFALMRFSNGRIAQFGISHAASAVSSYRVVGEKGDLLVESAFGYEKERKHVLTLEGKTEERVFATHDQFAPELLYFSKCVLEDQEPGPSGREGLADVRVITAMQESARTGRPVKLEAFPMKRRPSLDQLIVRPAARPPAPVNAPAPVQG